MDSPPGSAAGLKDRVRLPPRKGPARRIPSDEDLMTRFRATADPDVFEELARRRTPCAYRTALAILGARADAEDAVQECFLRVIRGRATYRTGMRFSVWFLTVLRNICRDELRRTGRSTRHDAAIGRRMPARSADDWTGRARHAADTDPSVRAERVEQARVAEMAFARLPEAEREILALRIYEGLRFRDIASACGISDEAAKKRAQRALDRLRRELSPGR